MFIVLHTFVLINLAMQYSYIDSIADIIHLDTNKPGFSQALTRLPCLTERSDISDILLDAGLYSKL